MLTRIDVEKARLYVHSPSVRMQVLSKALEAWGLQVLSLEAEEARAFKAAPTSAEAFICNLQVRG